MLLRSKVRLGLFLAYFLLSFSPARSQVNLARDLESTISIHDSCSIYHAGVENVCLEELLAKPRKFQFENVDQENANLGFTNHYYWVKFDLINSSSYRQRYYFETARPIIDTVTLYGLNEDGIATVQYSGDGIPFEYKTVKHRNSLFLIDLKPGEQMTYYVNIKSDGESLMLPLLLHPFESLLAGTYKTQIFYGFFYGILVLASIIYLFFFFALRDKTFLNYSLYVIFIGLLQFAIDGFFGQYAMPDGGWLYDRSVLLIALVAAFFLGKYGESFLKIPEKLPRLHKVFNIVYLGLAATFASLLLLPSFLPHGYPIANVLGLVVLLMIIGATVHLKIRKEKVDLFFIAGIAFLVMGFVVFILNNFNAISNSFLSDNGPKFGTGLEVIFLSISMSNLIRILRIEKEQSQQLALQRARDMNEIKSSFLSNLSHELRTPLNLIMGVTGSMKYSAKTSSEKSQLELIMNSSNTLLRSIDDILNFTLIEKGEHSLKVKSFDPREVLSQSIQPHRLAAWSKGLEFVCEGVENMPSAVKGDCDKLEQVLNALLDNAVKFTEKGKVKVEVKSTLNDNNSVNISFIISDSGSGIPKDKMNTIYESFTKRSFADKREFGGLGLGLFIAKTNVDLQNGEITLESPPKGGVVCKVDLTYETAEPLKVEIPVRIKPQNAKEVIERHKAADFEENILLRVLLAEDNEMNQLVIKMLVKNWGDMEIDIANNGKEAVDLLKKSRFDVVLMDLQMPVMDGFEAISAIRNGDAGVQNSDIPILAVTADVTDQTQAKVFRLGATDYMTKPIKGDALRSMILEHVEVEMLLERRA